MKIHPTLSLLAAAGLFGLSPVASATSTWGLAGCTGGSGYGNALNCAGGASSLSVRAWSDNVGYTPIYATAEVRVDAQGLGVRNTSEPGTSGSSGTTLDNATPGRDMILLSFGSAVALNSLSLGYVWGDSDLSVLAYTSGTGDGATSITGKTSSQLVNGGGWSLVSQVAGDSSASGARTFNGTGTFTSSWWLISAYNSNFGGTSITGGSTDYVKLLSVAGNMVAPPGAGKVSEPASLALVGLGMLGAWGLRRRVRKATA